jgi:hypothetical protein
MKNEKNRVLGRVLAVEETRDVTGARQSIATIIDIDNVETTPTNDVSSINDDSGTCGDSYSQTDTVCSPNSDVIVTDPLCDSGLSTTIRDVCLEPA